MQNKFKNGWIITDKIGEGNFGEVYKAISASGKECAVKYIKLPKDEFEIDKLIENDVIKNKNEANVYYENIMNNIKKEIQIMQDYNGNPYIIDCYEVFGNSATDGSGIEVYIFMEYATDIDKYFSNNKLTIQDVIKLGIDICNSLELCSKMNIIHNDIKPTNIFYGSDEVFKLGDFDSTSTLENYNYNGFATMSYISPEAYNKQKLNSSTDLYSLGLVMYKLLAGTLPFVGQKGDIKKAFEIRMSGKEIPVIKGIDKNLMAIVKKACSFNQKDRYKDVSEMKNDLENLSSVKKKELKFIVDSPERTVSIYDKNKFENMQNKIDYLYKINNNKLFKIIKSFFAEKTLIKIIILIIILLVAILLLFKGCSHDKKCDNGYVNKNGSCVRGYYYCDVGYSLNKDNKCQKVIESEEAKISYSCKKGYTFNEGICISSDIRKPKFVYKCADGYTLKDTRCEKVETADAALIYSCPTGYVLAGDECVTVTSVEPSIQYSCPDNSYTLSGNKCTKYQNATVKYTCNSGGTLNGTTCEYTTEPSSSGSYWGSWGSKCDKGTYNYYDRKCHYTENATSSYSCSSGVSNGLGKCLVTTNATQKYDCPSGYTMIGGQCAKTSGIKATAKYICSDDAVLNGKKCYATITTDAFGMYDCDEGFVISGTMCYKNDFPKATKKYTCSKVYTLNGDKCEKYDIINAHVHYD